jgi:hypothetical protein
VRLSIDVTYRLAWAFARGVATDGHELLVDAPQGLGIGLTLPDELRKTAAWVAGKQLGDDTDLVDQRRLGSGRGVKRDLVADARVWSRSSVAVRIALWAA